MVYAKHNFSECACLLPCLQRILYHSLYFAIFRSNHGFHASEGYSLLACAAQWREIVMMFGLVYTDDIRVDEC